MKAAALTAVLAAGLGALLGAQDKPRQFRAAVETVPIYATVVDGSGRLVPDLTEKDFEVLDNGKLTPISLFVAEIQPIAVVIAIDTSLSMTLELDHVKDAAEAFMLRLLPADRAIVVTFDDKVRDSGAFTSNRDALIRYLRTDLQFGNGTRLWDALYQGAAQVQNEPVRKVVLVLSDGEDTTSKLADGEAVLSRAQDHHVMVYAIGMRNIFRGGPNGQWVESRPDPFLRKLTTQTGGGYFDINRKTDLNTTFTRVAEELHRQYLIGITPGTLDGRSHKLELRVKVPGMKARARTSYVASKPDGGLGGQASR
jgi:Ca-activated chloride channel family protein